MRLRTAIILVALVPLASAGAVLVPNKSGERWAEMAAWAESARKAWVDRDFARAPAVGDGAEGAAFAHYAEALRLTQVLGPNDKDLLRDLRLAPQKVELGAAEAFALRWQAPLQALRTGARCRDARPLVEWDQGLLRTPTSLLAGRDLMNASVVEVRRRIAAGDGLGGVELLLDALTYGTDLLQTPLIVDRMIACAIVQIGTREALRDEDLRRLDAAALQRLDDGLARLDARCPLAFDFRGEALLVACSLLGKEGADAQAVNAERSWRYGWSKRWAAADAVLAIVALSDEMAAAAAMPWPQRSELLATVDQRLQRNDNAVVRQFAVPGVMIERLLRSTAATLRLLRLAVATHRGDRSATLADPLGDGPLLREDRGAAVAFRSAGDHEMAPLERVVTPR